jgi:hypothetical protein
LKLREIPHPSRFGGSNRSAVLYAARFGWKSRRIPQGKPKTDPERCNGAASASGRALGFHQSGQPPTFLASASNATPASENAPGGAKQFDDAAFLSHKAMLERDYPRRAAPELFF